MKMRKIIAVMAAALMLLSILPMAVFAADTQIVFNLGANGSASHADGTSQTTYSETVSGYALTLSNVSNFYTGARDAKGNSCIKLGASSKAGGFSFTVPADVTSVIIAIGKYKANTTKLTVNGTAYTLTKNSNDGAYDEITVDTTSNKNITLTTVSGGYRAMINTITYVIAAGNADCDHDWADATCTEPATCTLCGATEGEALGHSYVEDIIDATCTATGTATYECSVCSHSYDEVIPMIPHDYVDGFCSVCGAEEPNLAEYTITFDANKTQRTEFSTTKQVWKNGPLTFTNNKANSTNAVADYGAPVRLYQGSQIVIECIGMTQIVFDCNGSYATALQSSIGAAATVSGDKVTVEVSDNTFTAALNAQVRIDSITVTAEVEDAETCEHKNVKECTVYCPDCGELINEGATHVSNAQYPCYAGACIYCGEAIAAVDHVLDADDICTVCGLAPTPEKPVDPENPQLYTFSEFAAGTQYAEGEKHFLDNAVTVITTQSHFTNELRIYASDTHNGYAVIKSKKDISAIVLNAGYNADVLNLYVSEDGEVYEAIQVTSSYKDYTVLIPETTRYIKLDVNGEESLRIAKMTLYFDGEVPHVCEFVGVETKAPTCGEDGVMTYSCTCGEGTYTDIIPATGEHTYDDDYDADCNVCGAIREVAIRPLIGFDGKSASEDVSGLAFRFTIQAAGVEVYENTKNTYKVNSGVVVIDDVEYTMKYAGAIVTNQALAAEDLTIANAQGNGNKTIKNIGAKYLWALDEASFSYAVRVTGIPEANWDTEISARPYFVYADAEGNSVVFYGDVQSGTYNEVIG